MVETVDRLVQPLAFLVLPVGVVFQFPDGIRAPFGDLDPVFEHLGDAGLDAAGEFLDRMDVDPGAVDLLYQTRIGALGDDFLARALVFSSRMMSEASISVR